MAITRIPEPYRSGLAKIRGLSASDIDAISNALATCPLHGGIKGMIATVRAQAPTLTVDDIEDIIRSLYSLYIYRGDSDTPVSSFIPELIIAMRSSGKDLVIPEEEKIIFQERITRLLSIDALAMASKAETLRDDHDKSFHDAKILTDIRPLFTKPDEKPLGAAITHMLKIEYHQEGEHKILYMYLDADDLELLKKVVQRAETKASSLQALIKSANLLDLSREKSR
jgi:hypothetical protein